MTLVFLFTMGIGQMWADNTPASVGTYETHSSSSKPGKDGRCVRLGDGVFMHRVSNSSWDSNGNGMKLSGNTNGIVLYLSSSMTFQASIYKKETKSAQTGTFKIYTISETNYSWFETNAGTNETKTLTDGDKTLTSSSCTYSFEAVNPKTTGSTTTNEVELSAGYYYIVPSEDETSNNVTFLYSVTLAAGSGGGGQEASTAPTIKTQPSTTDAQYLKDATGATALSVEAEGNGTLSYQWYKNTSKSNAGGTALENCTTATYTPSTAAEGKLYYYCAVTNTESGKSATTVKSNVSGMVRVVPAPTHLVENVMATSGNWDSYIVSTNAHISNLKTITASDDKTLIKSGKESASSSRTPGITSNSSSSLVEGDHIYVQFTIEDGYELTVSDASVQVFSISNPGKYVARISDNASTPNVIATTETTVAKSDDADLFEGYDFSDSPKLSGTVTLKLFAYGWSDGYRMKSPLYIDGTVTAKKVVKTTDYALTDVKVNGTSISAANLATLKMASAYKVDLADQFAAAPTIKFNKETTITYTDDSQKVTDEEISVDATIVDGKWQAQAEIGGITYTVTAVKVTSFTVNYFDEDGTTSLGSEVVSVTGHPNASEITVPTKSFKTFADWKLSGTVVDLNNVSAGAGETVTLVASYTPAYAQSINIEQWVLDNSKNNTAFRAVLDARHYEYANLNDVDSLRADKNDGDRNEPYLGQKWKLATSEISFLLKSGSTVRVKFGNVGSNVNIKLGDNDPIPNTAAQLESPYEYTATEDVIVRLQGTGTGTVVVKQIMIDDAIATVKLPAVVTYDAGAGTFGKANEKYTGTPLVIADATPAEDYTFAGWFLGEDQINAAAYEPAKDITLVAHYAPKEYAIAYDGNGATSGSMSVGAAGWGTMVTPDANAFEKTGHVFSGWEITKTSDGSATGITFSEGKFEMPKYDVTLVAQWEDNSKVAMIVETNVKYNDLAAAIEAAEPGQTVQLVQDITQEEAILIDKNLTLDLNNKTFTVTNPSSEYSNRAIKVTAGTVIIKDGTVDALSNENHDGGCWGGLRQEGGHLTCNNVTFKNYRRGGLGLKPVGGTLILNECTVLSDIGGGLELGNAIVEVNNCTFTQTGTDANKIYGACFGMGKMGTLTINGGTYTSDNYSFYIYTSGGTINVNSGTFAGDIKTEMNNTQYPSAVGTINISGGTFDGVGENPIVFTAVTANDHISISGGVFDAPIEKQYCAVNYVPKDNGDGSYGVKPKDGVCLIKGNVDNNTFVIDEEASLLSGTPSKNNVESKSSTYQTLTGWKFNSRPAHLGLTLSEGTFQKGDVVEVFVTSVVDNSGANDKMRVFTANDVTKMLVEGEADMVKGVNRLTLPETTTNALYLVRGSENADYDMWNPYVAYFAVYRPMMPELTAITINDIAATKGTGNAFSVTLPNGANLASLTVVPTVIRNEAHATTPETVITNEGAWVFGENTYRVMDKDGDYTDYTITLVEAAGIKEVQIFGTLNVMEEGTTTLSALVIDTNDEEAAIQDVTWASDAEGVATVVNGVVTGVAVGTAHITATSVADGSKSKTVEVTVTPFSGCKRAFWFAYADDAAANSVTNNSTVFVSCPTGSSNTGTYKLTIGTDEYTATKNGGSFTEAARLVIPSGFSATFYAKVRGSGSNKKITLISTADESVKYSSGTFSSSDAQVSIEDIPAGTYKLTSDGLSRLYVMAVEMCKYPMEGVSLTATESVLVGQTVTLTPVFDPTNASNKNVTWESDDEDVATVANGVVTGVAAGTANITVTTEDGNFHATCAVTVSELDCDTYLGNLFALTIKDVEATSVSVNTEEINMSTYATIENGTAFVARTDGSGSHKIATNQSSVIQMQYNTDKLYLKLNLQNCALMAGDMITITGTDNNEFSFTTDATHATTYKTTGHKYVVQYGDALVGASTIYVWRVSGNTYMKSISIDRVAPSYPRSVNPAYLGTLCWTNNAAIVGATLFEFAGKNENNYLVFDEVISKRLEAGKPYIFMPEDGITEIKLYNTDDAAALTQDQAPVNNMYGTITGKTLVPGVDDNMYYFSSNHIWRVGDFSVDINVPAYYCYIDYPAVLAAEPAPSTPAPGRRRVTMGVQGQQVATGVENVQGDKVQCTKMLIDGQLFIIRGEKMFDAKGQLVK